MLPRWQLAFFITKTQDLKNSTRLAKTVRPSKLVS